VSEKIGFDVALVLKSFYGFAKILVGDNQFSIGFVVFDAHYNGKNKEYE